MNFAFTAKSQSGEVSTGVLTADSLRHAQQQLREQGLFPTSLKAISDTVTMAISSSWTPRAKVPKRDLLTFTTQLAVMTRAGMDLASSLGTVAKQCSNPTLRRSLATPID